MDTVKIYFYRLNKVSYDDIGRVEATCEMNQNDGKFFNSYSNMFLYPQITRSFAENLKLMQDVQELNSTLKKVLVSNKCHGYMFDPVNAPTTKGLGMAWGS